MGSGVKARGPSLVGYGERDDDAVRLPSPPTQARGVDKRDRIYRAAIALYASEGIAATKVEDVIVEAGVSWATFFRYFPRKQDVLIELAARHYHHRVKDVAEAGLADGRLRTRTILERTFTALLESTDNPAELHIAAVLEVFAHPARFAALVKRREPATGRWPRLPGANRCAGARRVAPRHPSGSGGAHRGRRRPLPRRPGCGDRRRADGAAGECAGCAVGRAKPRRASLATFRVVILARASLGSASIARSHSLA